jgi:hypothetical protein
LGGGVVTVDDARERILSKIRKLQALAKSDNEHEASTAAARAAELLAEHQIAEAELGEALVVDEGISDHRGYKVADWEALLANGIGTGTGARVYFERTRRGRDRFGVWKAIGTPDQVATARYLLQALRREIMRLSDLAYDVAFPIRYCEGTMGVAVCTFLTGELRCLRCRRPRQVRGDARAWKGMWRQGCAARVGIRLARARADALARAAAAARAQAAGAPTSTALVRVDRVQEEIRRKASQYTFTRAAPVEIDRENVDALVLGSMAGDKVPLQATGGELGTPAAQIERKR